MISYCHKLDVCLCVSLLLVYPDETARPGPSEWRTFGMADPYRGNNAAELWMYSVIGVTVTVVQHPMLLSCFTFSHH